MDALARIARTAVAVLALVAALGAVLAWRHPLFRAAVRDVLEIEADELRGLLR